MIHRRLRLHREGINTNEGSSVDPYLLIGALLEGAVDTLAKHIPAERQKETMEAMGRLLVERLRVRGLA